VTIKKPTATCPHCGEKFTKLKDGVIPTHDFPRPCRQVCRGSGEQPKQHADTPLWKDDPSQQGRDFFEQARTELLIYGFAVVKQMAVLSGDASGLTTCPLCGKQVRFSIASCNGHCAARCETEKCIHARE
jgi:endogenous inhibitor of DNA gyrase (YacG/DUF329 family)